MTILTGLSGNEMFCLNLKGLRPGELVLGNSVHSLGFMGGIAASLQFVFGGEVTEITNVISAGRHEAQQRLEAEAARHGADGITGVTSELRHMQGFTEFLSVGSGIHRTAKSPGGKPFSSSCHGQDLYCMLDAGYTPNRMVMGNVAYSVGIGGGIIGMLKSLGRGEIKEFSDIFNNTRHVALLRIAKEAKDAGANAVVGIETSIMPFKGVHEMLMLGTAAHHPALPARASEFPVTSDLTAEEMWNLATMGFMPLQLVLSTSVYSLGLIGGIKAMFKGLSRGEISDLTSLIYDARGHAIGMLRREAESIGADDVVGIKTHIHEMGGLIEFMAIGTAVKKIPGCKPTSDALPAQAIIRERDTWFTANNFAFATVGASE